MSKGLFSLMLRGSSGSSVGLSVCHGGVTNGVTNAEWGRGGVLARVETTTGLQTVFTDQGRRLVGAALAQVVDAPPFEVKPVTELGRVCVVMVKPVVRVDPVMPLILGPVSGAYVWQYRRYFSGVLAWVSGDPLMTHGRLRRLERRLALACAQLLSEPEWLFFTDYLAHGRLGEMRWGGEVAQW
jgi:hypothetical protein